MNKFIIAILAIIVISAGSYFLFIKSPKTSTPTTEILPISENIITYTDVGYSPNILNIKSGTTVIFKNNSSKAMWTASGVHPTHRLYPTTGGCIGSTFDACKGIQPGDSWSFTFDIPGTWKYHNHVNPSDTGSVIVGD